MPPKKRPSAAEQDPLPIESPRKRGPSVPPAKQREERRAEWKTQRRQVIKVPGGAVLRGCKKTKRKLMDHFQLRAGIHSQLRVIASLYVLRIFLTCLVGYSTPGYPNAPTPPAVQPPRALDAAPLPPLPVRAPAQPASMDWEPETDPDPEPEPEPEPEPAPAPPTLRPPSRWRPLELCWWPEQGALPAKGKEYPGLGYKQLRDKRLKAQQQQLQQPAEAQ